MEYECTEERFLDDIKNHSMKVNRDDGVNRHLSFTNNGSSIYRFDLITWDGYLCITGDCGTYVFWRTEDMFSFFRMGKNDFNLKKDKRLSINPHYWGEKLQSICSQGGYTGFDSNLFIESVKERFDQFWEDDSENADDKNDCWDEIENSVLNYSDDEHRAYNAVYDFHYKTSEGLNDFYFEDFGSTEKYTFHYVWCLYAIVYGVLEYDKSKVKKAA